MVKISVQAKSTDFRFIGGVVIGLFDLEVWKMLRVGHFVVKPCGVFKPKKFAF